MTTDAQYHHMCASELEQQAAMLAVAAREHRTKAAALEAQETPLNVYKVEASLGGTIQFLVHAPDKEWALEVARRWMDQSTSGIDMSQDMEELFDESNLPDRWDITEARCTDTNATMTSFGLV